MLSRSFEARKWQGMRNTTRQDGGIGPGQHRRARYRAPRAMSLIAPNALWALDLQFDTGADGRTLKMLSVIDEYTLECPPSPCSTVSTPTESSRPSTPSQRCAATPPSSGLTTVASSLSQRSRAGASSHDMRVIQDLVWEYWEDG